MHELLNDPISSELGETLNKLGIEAILFDLDDTLIYTAEIFTQYMLEYSLAVSGSIGIPANEIMEKLQEINDEEYKKMGVNPIRWAAVVEELAKHFKYGEKEIKDNLDILMKIYTTIPRVREGAEILLSALKETGIKIGLVTHANVDWTYFKLDALGLWDYFETVTIVDENGHKKSIDWQRGMDSLETPPEKCLVVGDSLSGDIKPGDELGARTVWMPSPWSVYRQGQVPEGTTTINQIFELLEALDRLR